MRHKLTLTLIVTQAVTLVIAGLALWAAFGPPSEDEMRLSRFYVDGGSAASVITTDALASTRDYETCEEAFGKFYKNPRSPEFSKPQNDSDRDAFMLGCNEFMQVNGKKS